jgi:hypothetical protein
MVQKKAMQVVKNRMYGKGVCSYIKIAQTKGQRLPRRAVAVRDLHATTTTRLAFTFYVLLVQGWASDQYNQDIQLGNEERLCRDGCKMILISGLILLSVPRDLFHSSSCRSGSAR